jgi:hypothetical protein
MRPLPRRIPVLDLDDTWQARADRHEPRARIDWLNVLVWGAVLALCAGVWAAIAWAAVDAWGAR